MNIAAIVAGSVVFIASVKENIPLLQWVFGNVVGIAAVSAATISLVVLWYLISKGKRYIIRVLAGFQMTMILLTTTYKHYPNIIILKHGHLSLIEDQGAEKTIQSLGIALLVGSLFILPALIYLVWSFQQKPGDFEA